MKIFKEKNFGVKVKDLIGTPIALASLGVGTASLLVAKKNQRINERRFRQAEKQHKETYDQQERLIRALNGVESGLSQNYNQSKPMSSSQKKDDSWLKIKGRKIFSEKKDHSVLGSTKKGALIGAASGAGLGLARRHGVFPVVAGAVDGGLIGGLGGYFVGKAQYLDDLKEGDDKKKKKKKKQPSEKRYGEITNTALKGGSWGLTLGTGFAAFMKGKTPQAKALVALTGAALGALAGTVWGTVKAVDSKISQSESGHKLIKEVIKNLNRAGYKRDSEWTTDPKTANLMKTKVCVVFSRSADELGLMINMASEPELKKISEEATKNLPWGSKATEKISDRFNEIQITSIPSKTDAVYIFGKIEKFIQAGYPVYLIEVG